MLYILTGDIQIGKTRWLQAVVSELVAAGVPVAGVLAPGVWRPNPACPNGLEKTGIDNVLLPGGERVAFARRHDLALDAAGKLDTVMPSNMRLVWRFSDEAVERVNAHFAHLAHLPGEDSGHAGRADCARGAGQVSCDGSDCACGGLLVVDELGRLELECGLGLTNATDLLARGPRPGWPHALVVVRDMLLSRAHALLDAPWRGAVREIGPTEEARRELRGRMCILPNETNTCSI